MSAQSTGPGRVFYVVALLVFLLGVAIAALLGAGAVWQLLNLADSYERVVMPGTTAIELNDDGEYTIFYEYESEVDGVRYRTDRDIPAMNVSLQSIETGEFIELSPPDSSQTYDTGSYSGEAVLEFDLDDPGDYQLSAEYASGASAPEFVLAVGQGFTWDVLTSIGAFFASFGVFCLGTIAAIVIALVVLIKRSRASRRPIPATPVAAPPG